MYGLFEENGPFSVSADGKMNLVPREYSWNKEFNVMYIDNPVGAGFSFTQSDDGYVTSESDVEEDLYSAVSQFFQIFAQYKTNDFYVCGESYGGKYAPSFSWYIHQMNKIAPANETINLKGLSIGDGLVDPITQFVGISNLLYYFGMADLNEMTYIQDNYETPFMEALAANERIAAFKYFDEFLNGDFYPYPTYFNNITGTNDYFNFLDPDYPPNPYPQYLMLNSTRAAIHVGANIYWDYNHTVEYYLMHDWMSSALSKMHTLMDNYKVMVYSGQNDFILGAALTEKWVRTVAWKGQVAYNNAPRSIWKVAPSDSVPAGYSRSVDNFTHTIVRNAGHMVPLDQPRRAYDMIRRFVLGIPFSA